jgi:predicted metal-dependent hydrolase
MTTDLSSLCARACAFHDTARLRISDLGVRVRAPGHDARLLAPWDHFEREVNAHFDDEERILFPALEAVDAGAPPPEGEWTALLHDLSRELDEVRTISDALREAARDAGDLEADLLDLLDDLEAHANAEANIILPAARHRLAGIVPEVAVPPSSSGPASASPRGGRLRRLMERVRGLVQRS